MGSQKRIAKELAELTESPPAGITIELANESNLYEWKVFMDGPEGSPYHVRCTFPFLPSAHPTVNPERPK
jgi:ubiquitin-protein ligase